MAQESNRHAVDPRLLVLGALPLFLLITAFLGSSALTPTDPPDALLAVQAMGAIALIVVWVRLDARTRSFRVSWLLWLALVGLTCVALPYYFVRSRGLTGGLRALGWALGVFSLTMLSLRLGMHLAAGV